MDSLSARSYRAPRTPIPEAAKRYRKGTYYEYKIGKLLLARGYYIVRSAGSRGIVDLVAIGRHHTLLIQAKSGSSPFNAAARQLFLDLPAPRNCIKELWEWKSPGKPPIITKLC
jgi:Holliday junction resolvase hjc